MIKDFIELQKNFLFEQRDNYEIKDFDSFFYNLKKKANFLRLTNHLFWYLVDLMIIKNNKFLSLYPSGWENVLHEEIEMAKISKDDRVLHIGCGPYPITSVVIGKMSKASIVAIDRNRKAVKLANEYITKKNIEGIKVIHSDGKDFSSKDFDVVVVTSSVIPREKVLKNVFETAKNNCRIICREVDLVKNPLKRYIFNKKELFIEDQIEHRLKWNSYLVKIGKMN